MLVWLANQDVQQTAEKVKEKFHCPRLIEAKVAVCFSDSKPFIDGRFNWGKVSKFSALAKLFHPKDKRYNFSITLSADAWISILDDSQREAWLDLHLERCQVEYLPVIVEQNGKKHPLKDEWGRTQYTDTIRTDDEGSPRWKVESLDLTIFQSNVLRYGCWCQDLLDFKSALSPKEKA